MNQTINERINADFIIAFKAKQIKKKNFLGLIKGEIQNQEGRGILPTDENILKILKKMEKSLKENQSRGDITSATELDFLKPYLPEMMSEEQIRTIIQEIIVNGAINIGAIMGTFNKEYGGQADNKLVSQIVKEEL